MELRTYTGLWRVEKRLYKFYDINLPYPVSVRQIVILVTAFIPWLLLMRLFQVPFAPPFGHLLWLAPPFLITWAANQTVTEGKTILEYLIAQVTYVINPKRYNALTPTSGKPESQHFVGTAWRANTHNEDTQTPQ